MNRAIPLLVAPLLAAGVIVACPSFLFAQPPGRGGPPGGGPPREMVIQLFTQADANSDGVVTKAELNAVLQGQGRNSQRGQMGPPPQRGNFGQGNQAMNQGPPPGGMGDHPGPPPSPGQVLSSEVAESLSLTEKQTRRLAALQADVDKRLAAILTDEQEEKLKTAHPPHGPGHGEPAAGDPENARPQRPE